MQAQIQQVSGKWEDCSEKDGKRIPFFTVRTILLRGGSFWLGCYTQFLSPGGGTRSHPPHKTEQWKVEHLFYIILSQTIYLIVYRIARSLWELVSGNRTLTDIWNLSQLFFNLFTSPRRTHACTYSWAGNCYSCSSAIQYPDRSDWSKVLPAPVTHVYLISA